MSRNIPDYALYGDQAQPSWIDSFHFERIPDRSRPYNWEIQPHVHNAFIQLLLIQRGGGKVLLKGANWPINTPCLVKIPAQNVHGFHFSSDIDGPVVTATQKPLESLAGIVAPDLLQSIRTPEVLPVTARDSDALMPLFTAIEHEWRTSAVGTVAAGMLIVTALLVQVARISDALKPVSHPAPARKAVQLEKFRALVDEHFREHLSVDAYAQELSVTGGQLTRICRDVLGISALNVINARLVHEAQRDLVYTISSVKIIAMNLGFADEAYFARFFRKHTGLSPKNFRNKALDNIGSLRR
ncbi:MAG: helix-turn-helix domain-containing protein [Polaromonas sp.]|nr:helix-turn-helix domain-containing protein [Polaromonas sp.]MDI1239996.1 helix-turn-helix domain-containing protein [Polaromonas sp.]